MSSVWQSTFKFLSMLLALNLFVSPVTFHYAWLNCVLLATESMWYFHCALISVLTRLVKVQSASMDSLSELLNHKRLIKPQWSIPVESYSAPTTLNQSQVLLVSFIFWIWIFQAPCVTSIMWVLVCTCLLYTSRCV